jgi:hypothetical protein
MLDKGEAASVTIVGRSDVPLKQVLGEKVGSVVKLVSIILHFALYLDVTRHLYVI